MSNELTNFNFAITSLDQALKYAEMIANSDLAPKDYKNKPGNVLVAMQYGMEIGLKPLQSIQNIAVINGRPSLWGDAMLGLVQVHPLCESIHEEIKGDVAYCTVKRRGDDKPYTYEFSKADAKTAGLLNKAGPWSQYPTRMLQMRARGFALRDKFSDILKGIAMREEVEDYPDTRKSTNILNATVKVNDLIQGKLEKIVSIEEVKAIIEDAQVLDDLIPVANKARNLSEADKIIIRTLYRQKEADLKALPVESEEIFEEETGEIGNPLTEFEKVKLQLINAKSAETLHIAGDLINSCGGDVEQHDNLIDIYRKRLQELTS